MNDSTLSPLRTIKKPIISLTKKKEAAYITKFIFIFYSNRITKSLILMNSNGTGINIIWNKILSIVTCTIQYIYVQYMYNIVHVQNHASNPG